jgi:hypothetical protein
MTEETRSFYDKSNMGPGSNKPAAGPEYQSDPTRGDVSGPDVDHLNYPSLSSAGLVEVELPLRDSSGPQKVEKVLAARIGQHISQQTEDAFSVSDAEAAEVMSWYTGCCEGAKLLGEDELKHMKKLARGLAASSDPAEFFATEVEPFLTSLNPQGR